jgi:hypothetical protein
VATHLTCANNPTVTNYCCRIRFRVGHSCRRGQRPRSPSQRHLAQSGQSASWPPAAPRSIPPGGGPRAPRLANDKGAQQSAGVVPAPGKRGNRCRARAGCSYKDPWGRSRGSFGFLLRDRGEPAGAVPAPRGLVSAGSHGLLGDARPRLCRDPSGSSGARTAAKAPPTGRGT